MKILVIFAAIAASAVAEPPILGFPYQHYPYNGYHQLAHWAYAPARTVIPSTPFTVSPAIVPVSSPAIIPAPPSVITTPHLAVSPAIVPAPVYPAAIKSQYHNQDIFGQATYGHVEPGQNHHAVQDAFGNKAGSFSYYNAEGKLVQTSYIADAGGYRVSSNDLPVAPVDKAVLPLPPVDTPEVAAAKAAHFAEVQKISGRNKRQAVIVPTVPSSLPVYPYTYRYAYPTTLTPHAYPTTQTVPKVKADGFLEETPEVALAKSQHLTEHAIARYNHYISSYPYVYPFVK